MAKSYSVTSAGVNPAEDRAHRMRMYFFAMSLRVACVASLFWVRGWWVLLAAAGAVFLPWFAVMVGNAVAHNGGEAPDAPAPLQLESGAPVESAAEAGPLIVIDVEPERRARPDEAPTQDGSAADPADPAPSDPDPADPADRAAPGTAGTSSGDAA